MYGFFFFPEYNVYYLLRNVGIIFSSLIVFSSQIYLSESAVSLIVIEALERAVDRKGFKLLQIGENYSEITILHYNIELFRMAPSSKNEIFSNHMNQHSIQLKHAVQTD